MEENIDEEVKLKFPKFRLKRKWQPREQRMLSEWIATKPFGDWVYLKMRQRLGSYAPEEYLKVLKPEEARVLGLFRRWADCVYITNDTIYVIEAMIIARPEKISQLELYLRLVPHTPELKPYLEGRKIVGVLLYALEDPTMIALAREKGFLCIKYEPEWLEEYLRLYSHLKKLSRGRSIFKEGTLK